MFFVEVLRNRFGTVKIATTVYYQYLLCVHAVESLGSLYLCESVLWIVNVMLFLLLFFTNL